MNSKTPLWQVWLLCWSFMIAGSAVAEVAVPVLTGHVIDQTATLTASQQAALEQTLRDFETKKGSQIAVLIVPSTEPETIEQYALRVAEQWKLGRQKVDDGAILVIAKNDRALRIEVGYGLEGVLTDITSKRIISETITPFFKQGNFSLGISAGVDQMIRVIDGEPLPPPTEKSINGDGVQQYFPVIFILALAIGGFLRSLLGRFVGSVITGGVIAFMVWLFIGALSIAFIAGVIALFVTLLSGGMSSGRWLGGMGGGRGGGFGGGGGGFSGGGGGFGGGGASGRW